MNIHEKFDARRAKKETVLKVPRHIVRERAQEPLTAHTLLFSDLKNTLLFVGAS